VAPVDPNLVDIRPDGYERQQMLHGLVSCPKQPDDLGVLSCQAVLSDDAGPRGSYAGQDLAIGELARRELPDDDALQVTRLSIEECVRRVRDGLVLLVLRAGIDVLAVNEEARRANVGRGTLMHARPNPRGCVD